MLLLKTSGGRKKMGRTPEIAEDTDNASNVDGESEIFYPMVQVV